MVTRLEYIAKTENINVSTSELLQLGRLAEGDMRKALTYLQTATRFYKGKINPETLATIAGTVSLDRMESLIRAYKSNSFETLQNCVSDIILDGYPVSQIFNQLNEELIRAKDLTAKQKALIGLKLAEADHCLVDGADEQLQLMNVCAFIMNQYCK